MKNNKPKVITTSGIGKPKRVIIRRGSSGRPAIVVKKPKKTKA